MHTSLHRICIFDFTGPTLPVLRHTQWRDSVGHNKFHAKYNGTGAGGTKSRYRTRAANDVKIEMNCESGSVFSLAMPWQKEQTQGGRNVGVGVAVAVVKRLPDTRGTTNLMIYVAHATSPAIPNLMLYDRRVALHIRILRHIHTDVYVHVRRTHRAHHGLSPADLTETYRCRAIRRERPTWS